MHDIYDCDVVITRKPDPDLPPPFECAVCQRVVMADRWRSHVHRPPVCNSCMIFEGHQVRFPGITRGDHSTLKRLTAVTDALMRAATWEPKYGHVRSV